MTDPAAARTTFYGTGIDLGAADLRGVDLTESRLSRSRLTGAILRGCSLARAHCAETDFSHADLSGANLTAADLDHADLTGADLTFATADRTSLRAAVLDGADVAAFAGTVIGPVSVLVDGRRVLLDWADLELWFAMRGARVTRFRTTR